MRKFLLLLPFVALGFCAVPAHAANGGLPDTEVYGSLTVTWIDENTIQITGDNNYTNSNGYGSCSNCVAISPAELRAYKIAILSECDSADTDLDGITYAANVIYDRMNQMQQDISTFQRFNIDSSLSNRDVFSNYVVSVENSQTSLDRDEGGYLRPQGAIWLRSIAYNNGIYDYANTYVLPEFTTIEQRAWEIVSQAYSAKAHVDTIRTTVRGMSESACQGCSGGGGGDGGGICGDCPCAEQLDAIKYYVEHIDDDFHAQLRNMSDVTNFIPRMDSYAKLVSHLLYNDGTIVVDDGENSWSNVYQRGESDLYSYDKSNILQRIELLLYGLVSNTSTNWGSATSDVPGDVSDVQGKFNDVKTSVSDANAEYTSEVQTISAKVTSLFNALNFFGAGNLSNFKYGEVDFGLYGIEFEFTHSADLAPLQQVCRTASQVFYWTAGVVFMLVFWYRVVKFTTDFALRVIHFFNNLLT